MPVVSKAQLRLMELAARGESDRVPQDVAREFLRSTPKHAFPKLQERIERKPAAQKTKPSVRQRKKRLVK